MSPELVAAIISLLISWFSITKVIIGKGVGRAVWLIVGAFFFLSWLGNSFQFFGATGWIVSGVATLLLGLWQFWGSRSGAITYSSEVAVALKAGKTHEEAILDGLNVISHRKPFNELTHEDKLFMAKAFGKVGRPELVDRAIVEAEKSGSVARMKNREAIVEFAKEIDRMQKAKS